MLNHLEGHSSFSSMKKQLGQHFKKNCVVIKPYMWLKQGTNSLQTVVRFQTLWFDVVNWKRRETFQKWVGFFFPFWKKKNTSNHQILQQSNFTLRFSRDFYVQNAFALNGLRATADGRAQIEIPTRCDVRRAHKRDQSAGKRGGHSHQHADTANRQERKWDVAFKASQTGYVTPLQNNLLLLLWYSPRCFHGLLSLLLWGQTILEQMEVWLWRHETESPSVTMWWNCIPSERCGAYIGFYTGCWSLSLTAGWSGHLSWHRLCARKGNGTSLCRHSLKTSYTETG